MSRIKSYPIIWSMNSKKMVTEHKMVSLDVWFYTTDGPNHTDNQIKVTESKEKMYTWRKTANDQ